MSRSACFPKPILLATLGLRFEGGAGIKKLLVIMLSLSLGPVLLQAQIQSSLPHIANGGFPGGRITTTFVAFNNSNSEVTVALILRKNDGSPFVVTIPGLGTDSVFFVSLDPGETQFYQTDGSGDLAEGSGRIEASADIGFSAIFTIQNDQGNFLTETGVAAAPGFTSAAIAVDATGSFLTGVGLQDLAGQPNTITFTLFNSQGQPQGDPVTRTLGALGHLGVFATGPGGLFPDVNDFRGKLLMTSNLQFSAVTLRQNVTPLSFTTLPVFSTNSALTSFELPQFASGGGILTTTFVFFNLGNTVADVNIKLTTGKGLPFNVNLDNGQSGNEFQVQVPACGSLFLQTDGADDVRAGAARVTSSVPIGVGGIYTLFSGGSFQTETGVGTSEDVLLASLPVDTTGVFDTGVALFNSGDEATQVTLTFISGAAAPAGAEEFSTMIALDPEEQTARLVKGDLFPQIGERRGMLAVDSEGDISAVTIRQNSAPLSFTTLPVDIGAFTETLQGDIPLPATFVIPEIVSNMTLDFELPGGFSVSGQVGLKQDGAGTQGFSADVALTGMTAVSSSGELFPGGVAAFNDNYQVNVPSGRYALWACYQAPGAAGGLFEFTRYSYTTDPIEIIENTVWDFEVSLPPTMKVSGVVSGMESPSEVGAQTPSAIGGLPDLNLVLVVFQDRETDTAAAAEVSLDDGSFEVDLPPGDYVTHVVLLSTLGFIIDYSAIQLDLGHVQVGGTQAQSQADITLRPLIELSGEVDQEPSANELTASSVSAGQFEASVDPDRLCADLTAFFFNLTRLTNEIAGPRESFDSLYVEPGRGYNFQIFGSSGLDGGLVITPYHNVRVFPSSGPRPLGSGTTLDMTAPSLPQPVEVNGMVRGPDGELIPGNPDITFRTLSVQGAENTAYSNGRSVVNGSYLMSVLPGHSYLVDITPRAPVVLPFGNGEKARREH